MRLKFNQIAKQQTRSTKNNNYPSITYEGVLGRGRHKKRGKKQLSSLPLL